MNKKTYDTNRPSIPADIQRFVKVEAGHTCSVKNCFEHTYLETHHINENREDNRVENLILLCDKHHKMAHSGVIDRKALIEYKKLLTLSNNTHQNIIYQDETCTRISIEIDEQYNFKGDDNEFKGIVQDLIFAAKSKKAFKVYFTIEQYASNLHQLDFLQEKRELSTIEKEEHNNLQTIVKNQQEKLTKLNNAARILFIGSVENYADIQFGTRGGEIALKGLLQKFTGVNRKTRIDIWKDNGFSTSMHLLDEELKEVIKRFEVTDYLYALSDEIRIGMAMPSIALELWYQISVRGHEEKKVMKEFNPSTWKFGLG
jgi:hypothetical protein